jgi:hypothetical protein
MKIINTTSGDLCLDLSRALVVPARGSLEIGDDDLDGVVGNLVVRTWFDAGALVIEGGVKLVAIEDDLVVPPVPEAPIEPAARSGRPRKGART